MEQNYYEYNANLNGIHILAAAGILFFALGQVLMPIISIFTDREPHIVPMIIWASIGLLFTALFVRLLYGSLKKRIIISSEKIVVITPFRSREILWRDIADVIHMTNKVNGITTVKQYEFKNYAGKTTFRMPENGSRRFSGDGDIVEVLFKMYEQRDQGPDPREASPDKMPLPDQNLRDAVFQSGPATKIAGFIVLALFVWLPAVASVVSTLQGKDKVDGAAIVLGLAVVILISYLTLVNITSRIEFDTGQIRYRSLFTREKTVDIASLSNVLDQNSYGFRSIILYLYNGQEIHLRGIRLHKISELTRMISMRMQQDRKFVADSGAGAVLTRYP